VQQAGVPVGQFHYRGRGDDWDSRRTQVQPLFLEHGLALADVRIAIEQAAKRNDVLIEAWRADVEIRHARDWDSVMGASENRLDFKAMMDEGKVLIVDLGNCNGETRRLVGSLIVTGIEMAALSRKDQISRRAHSGESDHSFRLMPITQSG
jgi:hypothetical protein